MRAQVVLVTGVSRYLGASVAARLAADERVARVIGVDTTPPAGDLAAALGGVEFVRTDLRGPLMTKVLAGARVDTVAHMAVVASPARSGGRAAMKELNVIGTMQLLAACQSAGTLRKLVVKSSTAAYGASFRDPAIFTEETEPREVPRGGYAKDIIEIEGYVRGFRRRRPQTVATVLRFATFVGSRAQPTLTRYFSLPAVPAVFGRDPRLQFLHVDDALEVLHRSIVEDHTGVYNVAGPGVLLLSQAVRRAGRPPVAVPEPGLSGVAEFARRSGWVDFSLDQLELFIHGRVVDVGKLTREYGFTPRPTAEAFEDFVRGHGLNPLVGPDSLAAVERKILAGIAALREARS